MIKIAKVTNTQVEYTLKKGLSPKKPSVDAEVFGDETHLAGGVTVAVTVPARLLQRRRLSNVSNATHDEAYAAYYRHIVYDKVG